mgnify:CR=1 FL=1
MAGTCWYFVRNGQAHEKSEVDGRRLDQRAGSLGCQVRCPLAKESDLQESSLLEDAYHGMLLRYFCDSHWNERTIIGGRNGEQAFSDGKTESNDGTNSQDGRSSGDTFSQRQQIYLLPGLAKKFEKIESHTKRTGYHEPYKSKCLITQNTEDIIELENEDNNNLTKGYLEVALQ